MSDINQYPRNDSKMKFDDSSNQYVLTEDGLISCGIDIRAHLTATNTVSPENVIDGFTTLTSDMIYQYIHDQNMDNRTQDLLIAKVPALRRIIFKAMIYQAMYLWKNGNLALSVKDEERLKAIDPLAISVLNTVVDGLGRPITYTGNWGGCRL